MKNRILILISLFSFSFLLYSFIDSSEVQDDWEVPAKFKSMENPADGADKESLTIGKQFYSKHCKSCHGKEGLGDGPKSEELDTPSGDFTIEEFQSQTDGELFYKTTEGRDDMPSFEKKIPDDEDRWLVVNYLRTFSE